MEVTERLTIDELARRAGMTVRNVRAHQSRGLLPPPEIKGRTGYYGPEHLARLQLIAEMQGDGFNLAAIKRLLDRAGGAAGPFLHFRRAIMAPFEEEQPEFLTRDDLEDRWGRPLNERLLEKAERAGLLRELAEDRFEVPSPTLYRAGEELLALGVPLETALEVAREIKRHSEAVAARFVELFLDNVWKPFALAGRPEEDWPRVQEALERLRPLASESVVAAFRQSMTEAAERAFGRQVERERRGSKGRRR